MMNLKMSTWFALFLGIQWASAQNLQTGAERLPQYLPLLAGKSVGLVVNHSSLVGQTHLVDTLLRHGICIARIFSPEHGFRGKASDGELVMDNLDLRTGLPIVSLYGRKKKPDPEDLSDIDVLVFDVQDVGARFYTYISTLYLLMQVCGEQNKQLLILDRPNPNGHYVDGPLLEQGYESFVGKAPIPIVHGCTVGELARLLQGERLVPHAQTLDLRVVLCKNYTHSTPYSPPVKPSPNLPDFHAVLLYPSLCLFEGTTASVGRGTATPFHWVGHPDFPLGDTLFVPCPNEGSRYPPFENMPCRGYDLRSLKTDSLFRHGGLNLNWLLDFYCEFPDKDNFFLKNGYFDLLAGTPTLRQQIQLGSSQEEIKATWQPGIEFFKLVRQDYLLYPE